MAAPVPESWRRIEAALEARAPSLRELLAPGATRARLRALERNLGRELPRPVVQSLTIHDGLLGSYLGEHRLFNYDALLGADYIERRWAAMKRLDDQAALRAGGCPLTRGKKLKNDRWWNPAWIPVTDADGDGYTVDLDPGPQGVVGQVFRFSHSGARPRKVVARSYAEWLELLAHKLGRARANAEGELWVKGL